jgi:hypothetical protein
VKVGLLQAVAGANLEHARVEPEQRAEHAVVVLRRAGAVRQRDAQRGALVANVEIGQPLA